jgi:hypothetical protein
MPFCRLCRRGVRGLGFWLTVERTYFRGVDNGWAVKYRGWFFLGKRGVLRFRHEKMCVKLLLVTVSCGAWALEGVLVNQLY